MIGATSSMQGMQAFGGMSGAQGGGRPPPPETEDLISMLDQDGSDSLSLEELEDTQLGELIGDDFSTFDTDDDGQLSFSELESHKASHQSGIVAQGSGGMGEVALNMLLALQELDATEAEESTSSVADILSTDDEEDA